ncbi:HNH endonuclease signature motif containing protein [Streptomyces sp. DSM 41982]|uniref:HNH endonuclease signature motif containing protein n=1 Tax=Streptomyces evansiae TaxID=3075535 RepID=A0ABD5ED56_9ACTN|nr:MULTISPECIES: HNH endonuclease signature motif containing protein [unclassified Streptomyces]MDT0419361.1 HNH endonuclease signature motif containing protein [Streptomyces sp. DSM 41982]SCE29206.1 HNH endonuclease [Streptomyces sp. SolWspMP-sol7th]
MSAPKYPRSLLADAAPASGSLLELLDRIGAPASRTVMRYVEQRLRHYGIDTSHFRPSVLPAREPVAYTREALAEAVRGAKSLREVGIRLGLPEGDVPYSLVRKRIEQFGIDISHLSRTNSSSANPSPDRVRKAVAEARSAAEALRLLGLEPHTGARRRLRDVCERNGISTAHFLGQASRKGIPRRRKPASAVLVVKPPTAVRTSGEMLRRALSEMGRPHVCEKCGLGTRYRGRPLMLEIDHVNGDWRDNRAENLRYLCPNCHSQTATFAGGARR